VYTSSRDGTLRRWDARTGAATIVVAGSVPIRDFGVAADGRIAAQIGDAAVLIGADGVREQLGTGREWCASMSHFDRVRDRLIAKRCTGGLVLVDGKQRVELRTDGLGTTRIAASPDGARLAGALEDRTVRVWDVATGRVLRVLSGHGDLVMDVAFSPDGTRLASASYDHTVRVWELATGRHRVLRGHAGPVVRVAWHGDHELVTASEDGAVRVWRSPSLEPPSMRDIAAVLERETTARIDASNRATTGG
jgi:WD40 repeat protein